MMLLTMALAGVAGFFRSWLAGGAVIIASFLIRMFIFAPMIAENRRLLGLSPIDPTSLAGLALAQSAFIAFVGFVIGYGTSWVLAKRKISN
jgi:hypothetical protein